MVQKTVSSGSRAKRRGRPPAYDADTALTRAMEAFWDAGYAATSLDDLAAATGMNRPSLYGAFGDKRALYLKTLEHYAAGGQLRAALSPDDTLREALGRVYGLAIALYVSGQEGARGCFLIGTATTEAVKSPEVRAALAQQLRELDEIFAARFSRARDAGEIPADADPKSLAKLASAILHSLALRSRAGDSRASLQALAEAGIDAICPGPARRRTRARRS
jgi:TetR/AcrR family transcriptional regulator, copper-responsive repressor